MNPRVFKFVANTLPSLSTRRKRYVSTLVFLGMRSTHMLFLHQTMREYARSLECQIYSHIKIFPQILAHCNWPTLMAVSRASSYCRLSVRRMVKLVIFERLAPFVGSEDECSAFFDLLHRKEGGILGETARDIFGVNSDYDADKAGPRCFQDTQDSLQILNLVVPLGEMLSCVNWFGARGYGQWSKWPPRRQYSRTVANFVFGEKEDSLSRQVRSFSLNAFLLTRYCQTYRVSIFESSNRGILQVMLAGTSSNTTNLLTPTTLYCAIPRVVCRAPPLKSDIPIRSPLFRSVHPPSTFDNSDWRTPCGHQCPSLVRKSTTDKGIASFRWNDVYDVPRSNFEDTDHLLGQFLLCWRFSRCRNVNCPNYQPALRPVERIDHTKRTAHASLLFWCYY